jgi:hypothetical protein
VISTVLLTVVCPVVWPVAPVPLLAEGRILISMLESTESERFPVKEQKQESSKAKDKGKGK